MKKAKNRKAVKQQASDPVKVYADGAGMRPDGKGSGFAWTIPATGERKIIREDGLTNNQAEQRAILSALENVADNTSVHLFTDSEITCFQLTGQRRVLNPALAELHARIFLVIKEKRLAAQFFWVPRRENPAGKLI